MGLFVSQLRCPFCSPGAGWQAVRPEAGDNVLALQCRWKLPWGVARARVPVGSGKPKPSSREQASNHVVARQTDRQTDRQTVLCTRLARGA
jgi:hypothetical protein